MKRCICCFFSFCAAWYLLLLPLVAGNDKIGYIFTGRFYIEGADPLGLNGAHFVLTATVDEKAKELSFVDYGDNQGAAVYPAGSCLTIWGAGNPALNITYLPSANDPDTITAGWTQHSATDKLTFNATFTINDGNVNQPLSVARFYVGLTPDCLDSLPCVPTIDWVYQNPHDLYGEAFSSQDVLGQSLSLRVNASDDDAALALQYITDAVAQLVPAVGESIVSPLWITPDQRPNFAAVTPPYYAGITRGPVSLSVTDSDKTTVDKRGKGLPGALYLETSLGVGGSPADFAFFFDPLPGAYEIEVNPEKEATTADGFSVITVSRTQAGTSVKVVSDTLQIGTEKSFSYTEVGP